MGEEDVRNAAERLRKLLRAAHCPQLSMLHLEAGDVSDLLRVLHFILLDSSRVVAQFLVNKGYDLYAKTDARFVEGVFRLLRSEFHYFPSLSVKQFLSKQFVARRLTIVADAAAAVAQKCQELQRQKRREEAVWSQPRESSKRREIKASVENHVLPSTVTNHAASILQCLKLQQTDEEQNRRQIRRASSETPVQINAVQHRKESVPASKCIGEQGDSHATDVRQRRSVAIRLSKETSGENASESASPDDNRHEENRAIPQPKCCSCSQDTDTLVKAINDLGQRLAEVSSALLNKMSAVEKRLDHVEAQMHDVKTEVREQREFVWKSNSVSFVGKTGDTSDGESSKAVNLVDKRRALDTDPPCAWPPQPSVFERY